MEYPEKKYVWGGGEEKERERERDTSQGNSIYGAGKLYPRNEIIDFKSF